MLRYETMADIPLGEFLEPFEIPGDLLWKSGLEYPSGGFHGTPYYAIYASRSRQREDDKLSYFFRFNTEHLKYELIEVNEHFGELCDKGIALDREMGKKFFPLNKPITEVFAEWEAERKQREQEQRENGQDEG